MRASNAVRVGISLALMAVLLAVFLWNVDFDRTIEGLTRVGVGLDGDLLARRGCRKLGVR